MLASTCFGNDAPLTHALSEKTLAQCVVDFVCTGMSEVLTFQVHLHIVANSFAESRRVINGCRASHVLGREPTELMLKFGIGRCIGIRGRKLGKRWHQHLRHELAAEETEIALAHAFSLLIAGSAGGPHAHGVTPSSARTVRRKSRINSVSFCLLRSTPELTSTPHG